MAKKEPKKKILNKEVDRIAESVRVINDYLGTPEFASFRTYCNALSKNYVEKQSMARGIDTLESFAQDILKLVDGYRTKDRKAQAYEESIYQTALQTIIVNSKMGKEYNNGFPYDIIDFYVDFGKYPFMDRIVLYKKASKLPKEDNIAVNRVIGGVSQTSNPVTTTIDVLLQDPYTIEIKTDETDIRHNFTYEEKKNAIIYMTTNSVPLCKEYFYKVLRKMLFGAIKIEKAGYQLGK